MLCAVGLEELRDLRNERIVRVRVGQQRRDRQEDLRNRQRRAPLVFQDIQTDRSVRRDVTVVDLRREVALRRLERVIAREGDGQEEDTAFVRAILRPHDRGLPVEHVLTGRPRRAVSGRVLGQIRELLVDPLQRHGELAERREKALEPRLV